MIHVTCAIIVMQNKILVTQRSERMRLPLKWEFPGGKLEEHESEESCIRREIREELNIEIEVIQQLSNSVFNDGAKSINLIPFLCKYKSGRIKLAEHRQFQLLAPEALMPLDWAPADIPIVKELQELDLTSWLK